MGHSCIHVHIQTQTEACTHRNTDMDRDTGTHLNSFQRGAHFISTPFHQLRVTTMSRSHPIFIKISQQYSSLFITKQVSPCAVYQATCLI